MDIPSEKNTHESPLVGVFVINKCLKRLLNQDFEFRSFFRFNELARAGHRMSIPIYFFSVPNVDLEREMITGTYYDHAKEIWTQKEFQFPDVLYDRRGGGGKAVKERAREIRTRFEELNILKVNSKSYFDKWDVFDRLKEHEEARSRLPQTKLYTNDVYLLKFLNKHTSIYLKSLRGSRGLQVMRLEKLGENQYSYSYFHNEPIVGTVKSETELLRIVRAFFNQKDFVIQNEINVLTVDNCKVDFRAEVQRNENGELEAPAISARVALDKSPITTHSEAYPHDQFILNTLKYTEDEFLKLNDQIHEFLFTMYRALEENYGSFGEIGIDFALDQEGRLWFIEANAKSAKVSLYKAYDQSTVERAFSNPLKYARYIYAKERGVQWLNQSTSPI